MSNDPIRQAGLTSGELDRIMRESQRLRSKETARVLRNLGAWLKRLVSLGAAGSGAQPQRHNTTSVVS